MLERWQAEEELVKHLDARCGCASYDECCWVRWQLQELYVPAPGVLRALRHLVEDLAIVAALAFGQHPHADQAQGVDRVSLLRRALVLAHDALHHFDTSERCHVPVDAAGDARVNLRACPAFARALERAAHRELEPTARYQREQRKRRGRGP